MAEANYHSCDLNALLVASSCFQWCDSEEDRMALDLYFRIQELAIDGPDYSGVGGLAALLQAAKQWTGNGVLNPTNRQAVALYIDMQNAIQEGATIPSPPEAQKAVSCYRGLDANTKRNLALYLKCVLNSADEPE